MNKKGFTLAELLGVITILAIIALIAVPTVTNLISTNNQKAYDVQISGLKDSMKAYASDHVLSFPETGTVYLTLYQLAEQGYTNYAIENPLTKTYFPIDMLLTITKDTSGFTYDVDTASGSNVYTKDQLDNLGVLELNSDFTTSVGTLSSHIKKATSSGTDLSSSVTTSSSTSYYTYTMTDTTTNVKVSVILTKIS